MAPTLRVRDRKGRSGPSRLVALCAGLMLAATLPCAAASAAPTPQSNAPPGNAGVQEYLETVPGGTGDRHTHGIVLARRRSGILGAHARRGLVALGTEGTATAELAQGSAPDDGSRRHARSASHGDVPSLPTAAFQRIVGASGPGGMGLVLPLLMLLSAIAAAGYSLWRRRAG
jgi:hypothetical protein